MFEDLAIELVWLINLESCVWVYLYNDYLELISSLQKIYAVSIVVFKTTIKRNLMELGNFFSTISNISKFSISELSLFDSAIRGKNEFLNVNCEKVLLTGFPL